MSQSRNFPKAKLGVANVDFLKKKSIFRPPLFSARRDSRKRGLISRLQKNLSTNNFGQNNVRTLKRRALSPKGTGQARFSE
jgi:hypothetical protein